MEWSSGDIVGDKDLRWYNPPGPDPEVVYGDVPCQDGCGQSFVSRAVCRQGSIGTKSPRLPATTTVPESKISLSERIRTTVTLQPENPLVVTWG